MILVFIVSCSLFVTVLPMSQNFGDFVGYNFFRSEAAAVAVIVGVSFISKKFFLSNSSLFKEKKYDLHVVLMESAFVRNLFFREPFHIAQQRVTTKKENKCNEHRTKKEKARNKSD